MTCESTLAPPGASKWRRTRARSSGKLAGVEAGRFRGSYNEEILTISFPPVLKTQATISCFGNVVVLNPLFHSKVQIYRKNAIRSNKMGLIFQKKKYQIHIFKIFNMFRVPSEVIRR